MIWDMSSGEYLAEMNSYNPVEEQVQALDEYLDTAIWENLMQEHQEDFLIHDFPDAGTERYTDIQRIRIPPYL